jgi:Ca-activated chloride channel family protein
MLKRPLAALALLLTLALPAAAQEVADAQVWTIAPQNRTQVIGRIRPDTRPLTLSSVVASASIDDQAATTTLVMTITNPTGRQQEAQVLIPVPQGATVRSFQLDSAGPEPTARILPREEARRLYDSIVAASRDPGLLEFAGFNVIKSSVFPVPAAGSQTVRISYENLLASDTTTAGTRIDYTLPRTESLQAGGAEWSFSMEVRSRRPIASIYSPSHEIATERLGAGHVKVRTIRSAGASGTLRISSLLEPQQGDAMAASILLYPDPEIGAGQGGYFLLLGGFPPVTGQDRREALKREVTIVLDRSGSMRGEKIEQAREGARQVLEGLADGEFFNIIDYSDSIQSFADKPVKKDKDSLARARGYLKDIQANGGTNIHDAIIEALRPRPTEGTLPVVLFLTDGLPTVGKTSEKHIRAAAEKANAHQRRVFTFGVGVDVNSALLSRLADASRGAPTFVLPGEDVEVKVSQVFRRLSGPVLAAPVLTEVKGDDGPSRAIRELLPRRLPDAFDGDQLVVLGKYTRAGATTIAIRGNYLGKDRAFEIELDPATASTRNAFVPRLWATRMVAELIDQIRQSAADGADPARDPRTKELVDEVVRLSTRWGILTEYTAFLVQEPPGTFDSARELSRLPARPMVPAAEAPARARDEISLKASTRTGAAGVNQDLNLSVGKSGLGAVGGAQGYYDANLQKVESRGIQQLAGKTFLWRNNRWIDTGLLKDEQASPDRTVEFGTDEYRRLIDELATEDIQGIVALVGDVYLLQDGRRVLVKMPPE